MAITINGSIVQSTPSETAYATVRQHKGIPN